MDDLAALEERARAELRACTDEAALRAWNTRYFGKNGEVLQAVKRVSSVPPAERKSYGQRVNQLKEGLTKEYDTALAAARERALTHSLEHESLDVTLPGRQTPRGRL